MRMIDALSRLTTILQVEAPTLVVHQEDYGSIGNNFIAATPDHPVLIRALEMATIAIKRGDTDLVWLSTGPGLLDSGFCIGVGNRAPG